MEAALLDELAVGDARQRAESWRYSRNAVRALAQLEFSAADAQAPLSDELRALWQWPQTTGRRLVFVNGVLSAAESDGAAVADVVSHVAGDTCTLRIERDTSMPLHVVQVAVAGTAASRWTGRLALRIAAPRACLIEQHVAAPGAELLGCCDIEIELAAQATLDLLSLSDLGGNASLVRRMTATLGEAASLRATHALFGGRLQRLDLSVALAGARARLQSRGAFVLRGREHADMQLDVRHIARDAVCDVLWRGVADQRARGIFHGGITVEPGADGSDARLSSKNVLLSPHAEIDTQPVLEIHADEVQAAHGATVGQIDERALFYLRSRGIPAAMARRMLVAAFCNEALSEIDDATLRERIAQAAAARLPAREEQP